MEKMFETAVRNKYRFNFKGTIGPEDLFDLSMKDLDSIHKVLTKELRDKNEESLMCDAKKDTVLEAKIAIVRHVFEVKKAEKLEKENAAIRAAKKQQIMELLSEKEHDTLKSKTPEQLKEILAGL